jgi:DNA-binding MarR family transcriptional regulator
MAGPDTSSERHLALTEEDFRKQAEFRYHLRRFMKISEVHCKEHGLEPNQFLLMLAVKGMPASLAPNITTLSNRLLVESHSVVELVHRLIKKGLIERYREGTDRRKVFLRLTLLGEEIVEKVASRNRQELKHAIPTFAMFLNTLEKKS